MRKNENGPPLPQERAVSVYMRKMHSQKQPQFVVCVRNEGYPASLELHKIYQLLPDADAAADGDLRVIDESGEDYLYPADWFVAIEVPQTVKESLLRAA